MWFNFQDIKNSCDICQKPNPKSTEVSMSISINVGGWISSLL